MFRIALVPVLIGISATGRAHPETRAGKVPVAEQPKSLVTALRASDFAEIYIIPPWISFVTAPRPDTVRMSGCKFFVLRHGLDSDRPQWQALERALDGVEVEAAPAVRWRQVYYGLVLGDRDGTIREIYSDHMDDPPGKLFALDGRRQVHLPVRFAAALYAFAARHPELAQGPPGRCPSREEPWSPTYIDRHVSSNR